MQREGPASTGTTPTTHTSRARTTSTLMASPSVALILVTPTTSPPSTRWGLRRSTGKANSKLHSWSLTLPPLAACSTHRRMAPRCRSPTRLDQAGSASTARCERQRTWLRTVNIVSFTVGSPTRVHICLSRASEKLLIPRPYFSLAERFRQGSRRACPRWHTGGESPDLADAESGAS